MNCHEVLGIEGTRRAADADETLMCDFDSACFVEKYVIISKNTLQETENPVEISGWYKSIRKI